MDFLEELLFSFHGTFLSISHRISSLMHSATSQKTAIVITPSWEPHVLLPTGTDGYSDCRCISISLQGWFQWRFPRSTGAIIGLYVAVNLVNVVSRLLMNKNRNDAFWNVAQASFPDGVSCIINITTYKKNSPVLVILFTLSHYFILTTPEEVVRCVTEISIVNVLSVNLFCWRCIINY